jgi:hypothetical protein
MAGETYSQNKTVELHRITEDVSFTQVLHGIALLPCVVTALRELQCLRGEITSLIAEVKNTHQKTENEDGWLDAKAAAKYVRMSPATFDKYRYKTSPKIKGYPLDGKTLYKKSDLDTFVRLYELKNRGLA